MTISLDDVRKTAALARLHLDEDEVERARGELEAILGYLALLAEVDVTGVAPMTHAVPFALRLRDDVPGPELAAAEALGAAPRTDGDFFSVPRVVAHDKDG